MSSGAAVRVAEGDGTRFVAKGDAIVLEESRRLFGGLSPADFAVAARVVSQVLGNTSA